MKKISTALAAGAALGGAMPALAQEAGAPADAFVGPRIEATIGYDHASGKSTKDIDSTADFTARKDGLLFGIGAGYDIAVGDRTTLGAETELTGSSSKWTDASTPSTFNLVRMRAGRDFYLGGRLGYAVSPRTLLYAKAGWTNARFNLGGAYATQTLDDQATLNGYRLGVGVEQKVAGNAFAKLEYRYSNYGTKDYSYGGSTPDASTFGLNADRHQVAASVGWRF